MNYFSNAGQDRLVATVLRNRRNGYFLDFGAFDGVNDSNTFYFERYQGWQGICVEPNPKWYAGLCAVRSCISVNCALWNKSRQSLEFVDAHGLSSLASVKDDDVNAETRNKYTARKIRVDTINPTELLDRFSAPAYIDYLSLDVEGVEGVVLREIDLKRYRIALMTVEHNHAKEKQADTRKYLARFGYEVEDFYNDDFFFNRELLQSQYGKEYYDPRACVKEVMEKYRHRVY